MVVTFIDDADNDDDNVDFFDVDVYFLCDCQIPNEAFERLICGVASPNVQGFSLHTLNFAPGRKQAHGKKCESFPPCPLGQERRCVGHSRLRAGTRWLPRGPGA